MLEEGANNTNLGIVSDNNPSSILNPMDDGDELMDELDSALMNIDLIEVSEMIMTAAFAKSALNLDLYQQPQRQATTRVYSTRSNSASCISLIS